MDNKIIIREATEKDYLGICSLINNELGYPNVDIGSLALRLTEMKSEGNYYTFVALCDNNVVGFIGTVQGIAFEMNEMYFRIIGLAVSKLYQSRGIGTLLLKHVEELAMSKGIDTFTLSSGLQRLEAHKFYEKNGYIKKSFSFSKTIN